LRDLRERIRVNGQMIEEDEVAQFVNDHRQIIEDIAPSFFEMTVAMAFDYFERQKVDVAVIEVGLGGRLDSTNIITPELSVITNIGLDHMSLLGNMLPAIAIEKGGIIKKNVPVIVGQHQPETIDVFKSLAENNKAPFYLADAVYNCRFNAVSDGFQVFNILKNGNAFLDDIKLPLLGKYQIKNVQTVCGVVEQLQAKDWLITEAHFRNGLAKVVSNTGLMGRWQVLGTNPLIICDTGHNEDGIREVVAQIKETPHANLHFVFGVVNDKSINGILELLPQHATYYFTKANIPRSLDPTVLKSTAEQYGLVGNAYLTVIDAFNSAKKNAGINDLIFIGGSTFVVAEVI
jgi:dihydrofolate synthase/folylpolyglutamate synthase